MGTAWLREKLSHGLLVVSVDAGTSECLKTAVLVTCIHVGPRCFVLRPYITKKTFTADEIAVAVTATLKTVGKKWEDNQFFVCDGCKTNHATCEHLRKDLPDTDAAFDWLSTHHPNLAVFRGQLKELLQRKFSGIEVHCRGHWIAKIIEHLMADPEVKAFFEKGQDAVKLFSRRFMSMVDETLWFSARRHGCVGKAREERHADPEG